MKTRTSQTSLATPLALVVSLCLGLTGLAAADEPFPIPAASEVKVYDRPSDDGSAIIIEWLAPTTESEAPEDQREGLVDVTYLVEVAEREDDFATGDFKTIPVVPGPKTRKTAKDERMYFGFSKKNSESCFATIIPAKVFEPAKPWVLTTEALAEHAKTDAVTPDETKRALAALAVSKPEGEMSPAEKAERYWLKALEVRLRLNDLVADGFMTTTEAARARGALVLVDAFEKDVAKATVTADAAKKATEEIQAQTRAALQAAKLTLKEAAEADTPEAEDALAAAIVAEKKATAEAKKAERTLDWVRENVRRARPADQRRKLDWLVRFNALLAERDNDVIEEAKKTTNAKSYVLRLAVTDGTTTTYVTDGDKPLLAGVAAHPNGFKWFRLNNLFFALIFSGIVLSFIQIARRNPNLFLRKIAGLDAVEEAIGRATEMGRSTFFVHGMGGVSSISVIAAINILSRVARQAADYDTRVKVMNIDPIVTAVSQEVVQQAYTEAGRPDAYDNDDVAYMTSEQFSYAAAVAGRMVREKPAAIFLVGYFMAESLLLAETGASTGAIQVAGTDAEHQLPFFITTCDYTLIGEELYAASAYLSREPKMLGSLRGQDVGKAFMMAAILLGVLVLTIAAAFGVDLPWVSYLFEAFS